MSEYVSRELDEQLTIVGRRELDFLSPVGDEDQGGRHIATMSARCFVSMDASVLSRRQLRLQILCLNSYEEEDMCV